MDAPTKVRRLTIETNHGFVELEDVTITRHNDRKYEKIEAVGICTGGGETSRLFWATSTRKFETGVQRTEYLWREPNCSDKTKDHWHTSRVSCG